MQESGSLSTARTNITERDRKTSFVVADSGGFQIQQGTLGPWRYAHTVLQSLRWQEDHGDYVMALDFPTGASPRARWPHTFIGSSMWTARTSRL